MQGKDNFYLEGSVCKEKIIFTRRQRKIILKI